MMSQRLSFQGPGKKAFLIASLLAAVINLALSCSAIIAERYDIIAERILDDPLTEERDVIDISEQTFPEYLNAMDALEMARTLAPLNSDHARSLANLYSGINVWQETMQTIGVAATEVQPPNRELRDKALFQAKKAVMLDPANADHHVALGRLYAADGMRETALEQFIKAIDCYPINGAIRYTVALQMLMMGMQDQARDQARILAGIDDSYRLDDGDPATVLIRERRPPGYEARLVRSYLYNAMEITWQISAKDPKMVMAIVPDNVDAREVARMFFENKGADVMIIEKGFNEDSISLD